MKNIAYISFLVLCIGLLACNKANKETTTDAASEQSLQTNQVTLSQEQINQAEIKTGLLRSDPLPEIIKANGLIQLPPNDRASINALFESFIDKIYYMEGSRVKKGDVLVSLKHPNFIQLQQEYQQAEIQHNLLQQEVERQQILSDSNVTAKKQFQQTKAEFETIRSQKNALAEKLKLTGINPDQVMDGNIQSTIYLRSPISGVVTKVSGFKGQSVLPQQSIMEVINNDHTYLELSVFEKNIGKIQPGQNIMFNISSFDNNTTYTAKVSSVGSSLDLTSRTITVNGQFIPQPTLIPGLYVEAEIYADPKAVLVLPEEAVIFDQNATFVFVRESKLNDLGSGSYQIIFTKVQVETGRSNKGMIEILEANGISPDVEIVIQGANYLKSEMGKGEED